MFFLCFLCFFGSPRRATEKLPKIPPQSLPRALRGPPREPEIDQLFASGGAGGLPNDLFWPPGPPPGAIWSAPGAHLGPTWRPEASQRAPALHFRFFWGPPGIIFLAFTRGFTCLSCCFSCSVSLVSPSSCLSSRPSFLKFQG